MPLSVLRSGFGIERKLYCALFLAVAAVIVLASVSIAFSLRTTRLAGVLEAEGLPAVRLTVDAIALLERHQRTVQAIPGEARTGRAAGLRADLDRVEDEIRELLARFGHVGPPAGPARSGAADFSVSSAAAENAAKVEPLIRGLFELAGGVLLAAEQGDGALARGIVEEGYQPYADRLMAEVAAARAGAARLLDAELRSLMKNARLTVRWVLACLGLALLISVGGVLVLRGAVFRLFGITAAIRALAGGRTEVAVPFVADTDEIGALARAAGVLRANTKEMIRRGEVLSRTGLQLEAALGNMSQGLCMYDQDARLVMVNARYHAICGSDPAVLRPGISFREATEHAVALGNYGARDPSAVVAEREAFVARGLRETRLMELGNGKVGLFYHEPLPDGGWIITVDDVTERRRAEERIVFMARHDALTRLGNRVLFHERIELALAQTARDGGFALLYLDLDQFKAVNDTLGHPAGDRLLQEVARRLGALVREGDTVVRLGGDEFAIVQLNVGDPRSPARLAERLIASVSRPYEIDGHQILVGTSVGITVAPVDGTAADELLRNADLALYRAKEDGRGVWRFFEPEMNARAQGRRALENDLRLALASEQLSVHYQPVISAATRALTGFEALLRWRHPVRGQISPAEFVPLAEEGGLIVPIGAWVLRQACTEAAKWPSHLKVAVNLSPVQFRNPNLVQAVMEALRGANLPASRLEVEITESVLLAENDTTLNVLHELRAAGVQIALDDFGTGYSSLGYLRKFPFDRIKIDQSFVRDLSARIDCLAIVRAMTGLARTLGIAVTAEGVETEAQMQRLVDEGCTEVQGFLFSPARPAEELPGLMEPSGMPSRAMESVLDGGCNA